MTSLLCYDRLYRACQIVILGSQHRYERGEQGVRLNRTPRIALLQESGNAIATRSIDPSLGGTIRSPSAPFDPRIIAASAREAPPRGGDLCIAPVTIKLSRRVPLLLVSLEYPPSECINYIPRSIFRGVFVTSLGTRVTYFRQTETTDEDSFARMKEHSLLCISTCLPGFSR